MKSILSTRKDGEGFYYGIIPNDGRQLNVRYESDSLCEPMGYVAYVGGERLPVRHYSKEGAEKYGIEWARQCPESE